MAVAAGMAASLGGCMLFDTRGGIRVVIEGSGFVNKSLAVRVEARGIDTVKLSVDGLDLPGSFPGNRTLDLDVSRLAEGSHRLRATSAAALSRSTSPEADFVVDRTPPALTLAPPPGPVDLGAPPVVEIVSSEPIDPTSVASLRVTFVRGQTSSTVTTATLSPDGLTVRIPLPGQFDAAGVNLAVEGDLTDLAGNLALIGGRWFVPYPPPPPPPPPPPRSVLVDFFGPADPTWTNGSVTILPSTHDLTPARIGLFANELLIATLGMPPWSFVWDTRTVAEGAYSLSLRALDPGWVVTNFRTPVVHVDRTPPSLIECHPEVCATDDISIWDCFIASFSKSIWTLKVASTGGYHLDSYLGVPPFPGPVLRLCPGLASRFVPSADSLDFSGSTDQAGNVLSGSATCPFAIPAWRHPWGVASLSVAPGALVAAEVGLYWTSPRPLPGTVGGTPPLSQQAALFWIPPPQEANGGILQCATTTVPSPWTVGPPLNVSPTAASSGLRVATKQPYAAWVERLGTGPGQVQGEAYWPPPSPMNRDPAFDARSPSIDDSGYVFAWSEANASGGRSVFVKARTTAWVDLLGPIGSSPTAIVDFPSVSSFTYSSSSPVVAYIDQAVGGVPHLHVAARSTMDWTPMGAILNFDPASPASEPSIIGSTVEPITVVWVEGAKVLARRWDAVGSSWSAPAVLNFDAAQAARSPRIWGKGSFPDYVGPWSVAFIEASAGGDRIHVRRWTNGAWVLLALPANDGVAGPVSSLSVGGMEQLAVAWTDDLGHVYVRVYNE